MDIWIIRNGEKYGPFHDYDIRRKIEAEELSPDAPAWHEGLPEWIPISKIPIFENEFKARAMPKAKPEPEPPLVQPSATASSHVEPPSIPEKPKIIRRFWARWLDINVYVAIWWLILYYSGRDIGAIFSNQWIILSQYVPWFVIEILLIHYFATTPGKWLLGLRVVNADGSNLSLTESTRRALRVYVLGIGLGWSIVTIFCQGLSAFTTRRLGNPLWDHLGQHRVRSKPFAVWRILLVIMLFFAAIQGQMAVIFPYQLELAIKQFPQLKEYFEKNPQRHLPPRHK